VGDVRRPTVKTPRRWDDTPRMVGRDGDAGTVEQDGVRIGARGLPGASARADAAAPDDRVHRELQELPLPALRRRRELLTAEVRRARHWARLVRARRDLLVATVVDLEDLAVPVEAGAAGGPLEVLLGVGDLLGAGAWAGGDVVDPGHELRGLCLVTPSTAPGRAGTAPLSEQLAELATADRRLDEYAAALAAELALATEVFVQRCTVLLGGPPAAAGDVPLGG